MKPVLRDVRDGVLRIGYPAASEEEANRAAVALARRLRARAPRGLLDAVPGAATLLVVFDPGRLSHGRLRKEVTRLAAVPGETGATRRLFRIPVAYGGEAGLDLSELAGRLGISEDEFARRHAAAEYRVAFIGFAPGFPYLTGLPEELAAARLPSPRPRVPAGAVAIGGRYTGIYPGPLPGGWRLLGRAFVTLFDPGADPPGLLAAGDVVRFEAVRDGELPPARLRGRPAERGRALWLVREAGAFTSVQGAPDWGLGSSGVPPGGAMDLASLARANALVGNGAGDPALEIALVGPELEALADAEVAIAGADLAAEWKGGPAPVGEAFRVAAGERVRFGRARRGARAYLAARGGLVNPRRTGEPPRRIERGDEVAVDSRPSSPEPAPPDPIELAEPMPLRVILGPQSEYFSASEVDRFLSRTWRVSATSDRRGLRLEGEPLLHAREPEIPPEGTVAGSIQVPGNGLPIVLGPDGPVTGGYPKIATVIGADLALLGQAGPAASLRFRAVALEEAFGLRGE